MLEPSIARCRRVLGARHERRLADDLLYFPCKVPRCCGCAHRRLGRERSWYDGLVTTTPFDHRRLRDEARTYGQQIDVNPYTILLDEVKWRAGHVEYLRERIAEEPDFIQLFDEDDHGRISPGPLLMRYDTERALLDKACAMAARFGIAERYVGLAELHGRVLFESLRTALDDPSVGLTDAQRVSLVDALRRVTASTNGHGTPPQKILDLPQVPT